MQPDIPSILKDWVTPIVAVLALIRPDVTSFMRKLLRPGSMTIEPTGIIETTFINQGTCMSLALSLIAHNVGYYVQRGRVRVERKKDHAQRTLKWSVFKPSQQVGPIAESIDLPQVFKIPEDQAFTITILFHDEETRKEILEISRSVQEEVMKETKNLEDSLGEAKSAEEFAKRTEEFNAQLPKVLEKFRKGSVYSSAYDKLQHLYFWVPGDYSFTVEFDLLTIDKQHQRAARTWNAVITERDYHRMRRNLLPLLEQFMGTLPLNHPMQTSYLDYVEPVALPSSSPT